jgi:hypothetical protein
MKKNVNQNLIIYTIGILLMNAASAQTTQQLANPTLSKCILAPSPIPAGQTRPNSDFDCPHTPQDNQNGITADTDYRNWTDSLYVGKTSTRIDGFYTRKGQYCSGVTAASIKCPVAVKVKYVFTCNTAGDNNAYRNGKCPIATNVKVYRATYQAIATPGEIPITTTIVADKNVSSNALIAAPIPIAQITNFVNNGSGGYQCKDLQVAGGPTLFQKGVDQYGNPICEEDPTVTELGKKLCDQQMITIWQNGGTSTAPCEIITVTKVFKLNNAGKTNLTTNDCKANNYVVYDTALNKNVNNDLHTYVGGTLSGAITDENAFKTKYGITTSSPTFTCKVPTEVAKSASYTSNGTLVLDDNFVPGSIYVDYLYGGGGGGGASGIASGGFGGGASSNGGGSLSSVVSKPQTCMITIGAGGPGGQVSGDYCGVGKPGDPSSIVCLGGRKDSAGGSGAPTCDGGCKGSAGANGYGNGGAEETGCNMGKGGGYGAGGGGAGTCAEHWYSTCGARSGGGGGGGYAYIRYKIYEYVNW